MVKRGMLSLGTLILKWLVCSGLVIVFIEFFKIYF